MLSLSLLFAGCDKYDDSAINGRVDNLEDRVGKLEELARKLTSNIGALQESVTALEKNDRITDVRPLEDGSGFIVVFEKAGEITVRNGKSSLVSVRKDADGIYYWTVDGEYLVVDGEKIPATAQYGAPHIKIEDGKFWFSVDDTNWTECGDVATEGIGTIKGVSDEGDSVVFTLYDDSTISIPKVQKFGISIQNAEQGVFDGSIAEFMFTITEPDESTTVKVVTENGVIAEVEYTAPDTEGMFMVMPSEPLYDKMTLLVVAINGKGTMAGQLITLEEGKFNIIDDTAVIGKQGGEVSFKIETNVQYEIMEDPDPSFWAKLITEPETKAIRTDVVRFKVAPYSGGTAPRTAKISLMVGDDMKYLTITQLNSGGQSDFDSFKSTPSAAANRIKEDSTDDGWVLKQGRILGKYDWGNFCNGVDKKIPDLVGDAYAPGMLESPIFEDGIGTLKFSYGAEGANLEVGHKNGLKFHVDIVNAEGKTVWTKQYAKTKDELSAAGWRYIFEESVDVNIAGKFRIIFTNDCPSGIGYGEDSSIMVLDNVSILTVSWSGWSE